MSNQQTSGDLPSATSSPELQDGHSHSSSPGSRTLTRCGRVVLRASLSAWLDQEAGKTTHVTWLRPFSISLQSVALQSSLASKLQRQSKSITGSTLYSLNWKRRVTPAGRMYYQLQAAARPISATDYFSARYGWTTPSHSDGRRGGTGITPGMSGSSLAQQVKMTIWSTPRIGGESERAETWLERKKVEYEIYPGKGIGTPAVGVQAQLANWPTTGCSDDRTPNVADAMSWYREDGSKKQKRLQDVAGMANWPTASATDSKGGYQGGRIRNGKLSVDRLDVAAQLVIPDYPIRVTVDGIMLTGSTAGMNVSGPLNPEHSRWLMGFGAAWGYSKDMVTPSFHKSRLGSSVNLSSQLVRLAEAIFRNRLAREKLYEQNI